jgi:hypothetical protein
MKISASCLVVAIAFVVLGTAQAQIVQEMSPERIREAIAFGRSVKELSPYKIQEKARWSWPPLLGVYTTPFRRVALAANVAKKHYRQFSEADVTPEMIAPEIQIYVPSRSVEGTSIANVETIVILPFNSKDKSQAVLPKRMNQASEQYKNLFGFIGEGSGMLAAFPLEVWREDNEVHVVFDRRIPSSQGLGARGDCTDCKSRIYLKTIR